MHFLGKKKNIKMAEIGLIVILCMIKSLKDSTETSGGKKTLIRDHLDDS